MAGIVTQSQRLPNSLSYNPQVQRTILNWTSDSSGNATVDTEKPVEGVILRAVFDPDGTDAPTDNYDVVLNDENGIDVLQGLGADRDTANSEQVVPIDPTSGLPIAVADILSLSVSGAGSAKKGKVILYTR